MAQPLNDAALDQLFRTARTYNSYAADPVSEDDIRAIWDLTKMGPTSANMLPARLVWCLSDEAKEKLSACASDKNASKIRDAPAAVVIGMDRDFHVHLPTLFPHDQTAKDWFPDPAGRATIALRNSSLQGAYFIVAARALGFDTGPMSGFDEAKVNAAFFADQPTVTVNFISTLGHGDPASIFGRLPRPAFEAFNRVA